MFSAIVNAANLQNNLREQMLMETQEANEDVGMALEQIEALSIVLDFAQKALGDVLLGNQKLIATTTERARQLLDVLVDNMIEESGHHPTEVLEKLIDLGFTKSDLIELRFPEEEIEQTLNA